MRNTSYYFQANKIEILLFIILFLISFSITIYHYSVWENSEERIQHKVLALFSGDEPWFLEITSTIIHHQSISPDIFYKDLNPDPNLIFPDIYYEVDSCRLHQSLLAEDGHCYSGHQPGLSILLILGYAAGGILGAMTTMNIIFSLQGILIFKFLSKSVNEKKFFFHKF